MSSSLDYFKRLAFPIISRVTASGGAVAIIRISAKDLSPLRSLFSSYPNAGEHCYSSLSDSNGEVIDKVLLLYFKAPKSFTGEDVLEIQSHDTDLIVENIISLVLKTLPFCERALAGEFSFRAFQNNKQGLAELEAINTLYTNENYSKLLGFNASQSHKTQLLLNELLQKTQKARGRIEAAIDFSEQEEEQSRDIDKALFLIKEVKQSFDKILSSYLAHEATARYPKVLLLGKTNVGKSTLFNILCEGERAIVSSVKGTTRDYLSAKVKIASRTIQLFDTAGFNDLSDNTVHAPLEKAGIEKTKELIELADLILLVNKKGAEDFNSKNLKEKKVITIHSHADKHKGSEAVDSSFNFLKDGDIIRSFLENRIFDSFSGNNSFIEGSLVNKRQYELLLFSEQKLKKIEKMLKDEMPLELIGDGLREVEKSLQQALGKELNYEYVSQIFSQFCLGK